MIARTSPGAPVWTLSSRLASLDCVQQRRKIGVAHSSDSDTHIVNVHRFQETIGGRPYDIEVTAVGTRWRAQLQRRRGIPTAMMPFYGQTPDEAAQHLAAWLTKVYQRSITSTPDS